MFTTLEKRWPFISILLLLVLLTALIFSPSSAGTFAIVILFLSLGTAIFFIVRRQIQAYRKNQIDRPTLVRNIYFEVLGLLITVALAVLLAQVIIGVINPLMGNNWLSIGIIIGLSMLGGLGAAWLVKLTWDRLIRSKMG
jgi:TRAP-type uncharacterized transport system fused permease subunit